MPGGVRRLGAGFTAEDAPVIVGYGVYLPVRGGEARSAVPDECGWRVVGALAEGVDCPLWLTCGDFAGHVSEPLREVTAAFFEVLAPLGGVVADAVTGVGDPGRDVVLRLRWGGRHRRPLQRCVLRWVDTGAALFRRPGAAGGGRARSTRSTAIAVMVLVAVRARLSASGVAGLRVPARCALRAGGGRRPAPGRTTRRAGVLATPGAGGRGPLSARVARRRRGVSTRAGFGRWRAGRRHGCAGGATLLR